MNFSVEEKSKLNKDAFAASQRVRVKRYRRKQFVLWKQKAYQHFVANATKVLTSGDKDLIFIYTRTLHDLVDNMYGITYDGKRLSDSDRVIFPIMLECFVEEIMNKIHKM